MMKPAAAAGNDEDVQVLVERPYSHDHDRPSTRPPPHHQSMIRARPYYRRWSPWLVSGATAACVVLFVVTMYVNDCPEHNSNCAAGFLGRFAFQPLKENPVGASGALFGLIGSMLSELITNWSLYANKAAAPVLLLLVIGVNLALGILPRIDNFAHIGGLDSGFVFFIRPQFAWLNQHRRVAGGGGQLSTPPPPVTQAHRKHKTYQYVLWVAAATALLFRGYNANDPCSWCHYLTPGTGSATRRRSSATQGNTVTLACQGTARNQTYMIADASQDRINDLCSQLCT